MGKLWVKIHLDVRPDEEEVKTVTATGRQIQEMMDVLYSDIMNRGDTMIIRVTDDDKCYILYQRAGEKEPIPHAFIHRVFSLKRDAGRMALLYALGNATDRIDPNIKGLIYGEPEAIRYMLEKTAYEVLEHKRRDPYVREVHRLLESATDNEIIESIKSVTFFVKKIKLDDDELPIAE